MKNYRFNLLLMFCVVLVSNTLFAQTITNVDRLNQLAAEFTYEWDAAQLRVEEYAIANKVAIRKDLENGSLMQMVDVVDGKPVYYITDNFGAAKTTRVVDLWPGGTTGLDLTAEGYNQLGEWDGGHVRHTHTEFTDQGESRVTNMDGDSPTHFHATHVAGTMVAAGINANAKGMAYKGNLKAWDWTFDNGEMALAAADGLEISNHSYGQASGWNYSGGWEWNGNENVSESEDYNFGFYGGGARGWDLIAYDAPNYLIVNSAGNDRGEGPGNSGQNGLPEKDGGSDGYDCIGGASVAKNILTVGAVYEVSNYTGPSSVSMSSFSCWGPVDDGRIKPDIVGKGVSVYSTMNGGDNDYTSMGGTSMSSPNVAGSLALLQSHYQATHNGVPMRSATLKGLVVHTADEAGSHTGPDYKYGWGLLNTEKAAEIISEDVVNERIREQVLEGGNLFIEQITVEEGADFKITMCWTDPAGIPVPFELNPRDPMIVNDLDIYILDNNFEKHFPYRLDPENPSNAATAEDKNPVDNVEMVHIPNAVGGTYTIFVTHDGWLENGEQAYSLIISGVDVSVGTTDLVADDDISISIQAGQINIQAEEKWNGAQLRIVNLLGQSVFEGMYDGKSQLDLSTIHEKGIHIINLQKGSDQVSKKIMLR